MRILALTVAIIGLSACGTEEKETGDATGTTATATTETTSTGTTKTGTTTGTGTATGTTTKTDRPPPAYGLSNNTLFHNEVDRTFRLYVPESYDHSTSVPLMMNFHGFGGTSNEQLRTSNMRPLAESHNFILVYPQGTRLDGSNHWNTYPPGGENKSEALDYQFVEEMLAVLSADYNIDASRVYATGYSNGGDFTHTLACFISDKVAAIAAVSGSMWTETRNGCVVEHPTAVMSMQGTLDPLRPIDGIEGYMLSVNDMTDYWRGVNNITADATLTEYSDSGMNIQRYQFDGGDGGVQQVHYVMNRGGHDWFSFTEDGANIDEIIWNFVSQFDQDGLR